MPFAAAWRDLEIIMLSEVNQTEKDQYHMRSLIMWNLKKKKKIQKELIHRTETDSQISKPNSFFFGGSHPWHMKFPGERSNRSLQLMAFTTATAMWDLSHICDLHHSSQLDPEPTERGQGSNPHPHGY